MVRQLACCVMGQSAYSYVARCFSIAAAVAQGMMHEI